LGWALVPFHTKPTFTHKGGGKGETRGPQCHICKGGGCHEELAAAFLPREAEAAKGKWHSIVQ